jgi:hypothetical protein
MSQEQGLNSVQDELQEKLGELNIHANAGEDIHDLKQEKEGCVSTWLLDHHGPYLSFESNLYFPDKPPFSVLNKPWTTQRTHHIHSLAPRPHPTPNLVLILLLEMLSLTLRTV